jgi:hypothetical protein
VRAIVGSVRYWLPFVAAIVCLVVGTMFSPIVAWILLIAAFLLLIDGATALFEKAGSTGNLWTHKQ